MNISALDIDRWADELSARTDLPILIRRLIHETLPALSIQSIDFPGAEETSRSGLDGSSKVLEGNAWVPVGTSAWEMGTNKDVQKKANADFRKRASDPESVFIFVTPHRWPNAKAWVRRKKGSETVWKNIRVLDASDLEQWLEQAPLTSLWLAERMGRPSDHLQSAEAFWSEWSTVTEPELKKDLILHNRDQQWQLIEEHVGKNDGRSIHIAGDTREEAAAYLCAGLTTASGDVKDRPAIVVTDIEGCRQLKIYLPLFQSDVLVIAASAEIAREIGSYPEQVTLLVAEASGENENPEATIRLPKVGDFFPGESSPENDKLMQQTGRSVSALRRKLAKNRSLKNPPWASVATDDRNFIWLALLGGWDEKYKGDLDIVMRLTGAKDYDEWRDSIEKFLRGENPPLEVAGKEPQVFKLYSREDAFLLAAPKLRVAEIEKFMEVAETVFGSSDPLADVPKNERWFSQLKRPHSKFIRKGLANGLILLSIHRDAVQNVSTIAQRFKNFFGRIFASENAWYALRDVLSQLAEASPDLFLKQLKADLGKRPEEIEKLFQPIENIMTDSNDSTHLLWALEGLAWEPTSFQKVISVFAELDARFEGKILSNYANRPINSLRSIFRSWMPQTAVDSAGRKEAIEALCQTHPDAAARVAMSVASHQDRTGHYSHTPLWRDDALGHGSTVTLGERNQAIHDAINVAIGFIEDSLGSLDCRQDIAKQMLSEFSYWGPDYAQQAAEAICKSSWRDKDRVVIYEAALAELAKVNFHKRQREGRDATKIAAEPFLLTVRDTLGPRDLVDRHRNMFRPNFDRLDWDSENEEYEVWERRVAGQQKEALQEIIAEAGSNGLARLVKIVETPHVVGQLLEDFLNGSDINIVEVIEQLTCADLEPYRLKQFLEALFFNDSSGTPSVGIIRDVFERLADHNDILDQTRGILLHALPACAEASWEFINAQPDAVKKQYFGFPKGLRYHYDFEEQAGMREKVLLPIVQQHLISGYLEFKRPRLAFRCIIQPPNLSPALLYEVIAAIGSSNDKGGTQDGTLNDHDIEQAFRHLEQNLDDLKPLFDGDSDKAELHLVYMQFRYIELIDHLPRRSDDPLLIYRRLASDPDFYLEIHSYMWKRNDEGENIPRKDDMSAEQREWFGRNAWSLLHNWRRPLPGQTDRRVDGEQLAAWVKAARKGAKELKLSKAIDSYIGQILARNAIGSNDLIPDEVVCKVLESANSRDMLTGFYIGRRNARGVLEDKIDSHNRSTSEMVELYREAADKLSENYPNLSEEFSSLADSYAHDVERDREREERDEKSDY